MKARSCGRHEGIKSRFIRQNKLCGQSGKVNRITPQRVDQHFPAAAH